VEPDDPLGKQLPVRGRGVSLSVRIRRAYHQFCNGIARFKRRRECLDQRIITEFIQ
jgi:hypothetical protein